MENEDQPLTDDELLDMFDEEKFMEIMLSADDTMDFLSRDLPI